jgi:hypothetical protein
LRQAGQRFSAGWHKQFGVKSTGVFTPNTFLGTCGVKKGSFFTPNLFSSGGGKERWKKM